MRDSKKGAIALLVCLVFSAGTALAATPSAEWSGTVAAVSGDDIALVGVRDHFRLAGSVTERLSGRILSLRDLAPGSSITLRVGQREADGRFRADRVVVQPKSPLAVTGEIGRIADDRRHIEVHGVEVELDRHTAFSGRTGAGPIRSARDLKLGTIVSVALVSTTAGTLRATDIRAPQASNESDEDQEFEGTVTAITDTTWTVDAMTFVITDQTVFEGDPAIGDFVQVKFHTEADGTLVADRIEKEDGGQGDEIDFSGIVEAIGDTSWTISGTVVLIDTSTEIIGDPQVGDPVEVHALQAADGTLTATRIKKENPGDNNGDNNDNNGDNNDNNGDNSNND